MPSNGIAIAPSAGSNIAINGAIPAIIAGINPINKDAIPPEALSSNSSVFSSTSPNFAKRSSLDESVFASLPEDVNFACVPAAAPGVPSVAPVFPSMSVAPNMPDLGENAGFIAPLAVFSDTRFPAFEVLYLFPSSSVSIFRCAGVSLSRAAIFAPLAFPIAPSTFLDCSACFLACST